MMMSNLMISEVSLQLIILGFAMFAGLMMTRILKPLGLPAVTSYLLAGLMIGPCILGKIDRKSVV